MADVARTTAKTPGQMYALVIGVVYLLVAVIGFFTGAEFAESSDAAILGIFHVTHVHNLIHVVLGVGWIWASRTVATSKQINMLFGIVLLVVAVLGFLGLGFMEDLLNVQGSGDPDNFLHLVTGALGLYFGTAGDRTTTTTTGPTTAA